MLLLHVRFFYSQTLQLFLLTVHIKVDFWNFELDNLKKKIFNIVANGQISKKANILEMVNRTVKRSEIWDSGVLAELTGIWESG